MSTKVLILVVVEDVLVLSSSSCITVWQFVLILVVVEDVLVPNVSLYLTDEGRVLILVVVEDVLVLNNSSHLKLNTGLNPCCSGRCSSTGGALALRQVSMGS